MNSQEVISKQRGVLGHFLKQMGNAILSGRSVMTVSFPVSVFEKRTLLERNAGTMLYAPQILNKSAATTDYMEQFRLVIAYFSATLLVDTYPEKPFNPILGETFQCLIGGCPYYAEQISHHPPICAYELLGKNFRLWGTKEFHAKLSGNSMKTKYYGY